MQSKKPLGSHDMDWLDKIAVAVEEDRTPEREASLAARRLELYPPLRDSLTRSLR